MIQKVLTIGVYWSPLELEIEKSELIQMVLTIEANWSPLELEIEKRDMAELIHVMHTIRAHWKWIL